jgi:ribonuclease BN (tRNA processing enzyme)
MNAAAVRLILSVALLLLLSSCEKRHGAEYARPISSATVETREAPTEKELAAATTIVMLGTGTPIPDAFRASASVAVVHKGQAYVFDTGAGAVHNATRARYRYDIPSLYPSQICCVFISHMHSDHTLDYAELVYTLWWRRPGRLLAFGPPGMLEMTAGMHAMMAPDVRTRTGSAQPVANPDGYKVDVTEIADGFVFENDGLRIEAFEVDHGDIKPAFGYRIDTEDRSIVISGDTAMSKKLLEMARGVDVLVHEVISDSGLAKNSAGFQAYHRTSHSPATDLGRLATEAKPGLLVLYHGLYYGVPESRIVEEVKSTYDGAVVLANDLDLY